MKFIKIKILILIMITFVMVFMVPEQVRAEAFITSNVPFSYGTKTADYDFEKYTKVSVNISGTSATQINEYWNSKYQGYSTGYVSSGSLTFYIYNSDGTLITSENYSGNVSTTFTFDLKDYSNFGYFIISSTAGPTVCCGGTPDWQIFSAGVVSASNLTLYQLPSPICDTNLTEVNLIEGKDDKIQIIATFPSGIENYQWQYSHDGSNWNNCENGANYAGATTNLLTIKNPSVNPVLSEGLRTAQAYNGMVFRCKCASGIDGVADTYSNEVPAVVTAADYESFTITPLSYNIGDEISSNIILCLKYNSGAYKIRTVSSLEDLNKYQIYLLKDAYDSTKTIDSIKSDYNTIDLVDAQKETSTSRVKIASGEKKYFAYAKPITIAEGSLTYSNIVWTDFQITGIDTEPPVINKFDAYWTSSLSDSLFISSTNHLNAVNVKKNKDITLKVDATDNSGSLTYAWYKNGSSSAIPGATSSTYQISDASDGSFDGVYTCAVTDNKGNITKSDSAKAGHKEIIIDTTAPAFAIENKTGTGKAYAEIYANLTDSSEVLATSPYLFINLADVKSTSATDAESFGTIDNTLKSADTAISALLETYKSTGEGWSSKSYFIYDPYDASGNLIASANANFVVAMKDIAGNIGYRLYNVATSQVPSIVSYTSGKEINPATNVEENYIVINYTPTDAKCWTNYETEATAASSPSTHHYIGTGTTGYIYVRSGSNPVISTTFNIEDIIIKDSIGTTDMATVVVAPLSYAQKKTITVTSHIGNLDYIKITNKTNGTEIKNQTDTNILTVDITENATYTIDVKYTTAAGIITGTRDIIISDIDTVKPTIENLKVNGNKFEFTAKDADSGLYSVSYVYENGNSTLIWVCPVGTTPTKSQTCTLPIEKAGTYNITVTDAVGLTNQISKSVTDADLKPNNSSIDTTTHKITVAIQKNPAAWTNGSVTLSISMDETDLYTGGKYSWDGGSSWTNNASCTVNSNGTYYVMAKDKYVRTYSSNTISVTNIDKDAPKISVSGSGTKYTVSCSDAGSGVKCIKYSGGQYTSTQTKEFSSSQSSASAEIECTVNGSYTIQCCDNAGNESTQSFMVSGLTNGKDTTKTVTVASDPIIKYVYRDTPATTEKTSSDDNAVKVTPITTTTTTDTTEEENKVGITTTRNTGSSATLNDDEKQYLIPDIITDVSTPLTKRGSTPEDGNAGLDTDTTTTRKVFKLPIIILLVLLGLGASAGVCFGIMSSDKKKNTDKKNRDKILKKQQKK